LLISGIRNTYIPGISERNRFCQQSRESIIPCFFEGLNDEIPAMLVMPGVRKMKFAGAGKRGNAGFLKDNPCERPEIVPLDRAV
jgi:hypothetical protein